MQFKTKSGLPFNSTEQREYFEKLKNEAYIGLEKHIGDPELHKIPVFGVFRDYKLWQKFDFEEQIPQITPMQLFLNTYKEFKKNWDELRYICESKLARKDIDEVEFNYIIKEINIRELYMESQLNLKKKKYFNNLLNENEKRTFFERLGESIIYSSKAHACKSSDTPENRPNQPNI